MRASTIGFLLAAPALMALAACSDDDDEPAEAEDAAVNEAPADETPDEAPADETPEDEAVDDEAAAEDEDAAGDAPVEVAAEGCPATDATGTTPAGTDFQATSAVAARIEDGAAYTLYLADFDLNLDSFGLISSPEVPEGGTLWTVSVTIFNADPEDIVPIEVDTVVEPGRPFGELTYTVIVQEGEERGTASDGQAGTLTVVGIGDVFCGTMEYADDEKSLSGGFRAPTKDI